MNVPEIIEGFRPRCTSAVANSSFIFQVRARHPRYLAQPEVIWNRIWALPDRTMHALIDAENAPPPL